MIRIGSDQMAAMQAAQRAHSRLRLVKLVETRFGRPEAGSDLRSPEQAVDAALEFAPTVGATTETQVSHIALVLAAVNRQRMPQDEVAQLRAVLLHPDKTPDQRIADAVAFVGITA